MKKTSGGRYNPEDKPIYFPAANMPYDVRHKNINQVWLCAVNELDVASSKAAFEEFIAEPNLLMFLDSGIFNLTMNHVRATGVTMDEALSLAPTEIQGFDRLWKEYIELVTTYVDDLWGFIELDQGGAVNKRKTRKRIEDETGLVPIPVYHPLVDGWDYFDELAEQYDRICFGNVVQAEPSVRKRLVFTAYERARKYPHLWIHLLGYTADQRALSIPPQGSCDSSSWANAYRFGALNGRACLHGQAWNKLPTAMLYKDDYDKARTLAATQVRFSNQIWTHWFESLEREGLRA